eukprot:COSAG02_NODE_54_length_43941_cov_54.857990_39_plen_83_part_00
MYSLPSIAALWIDQSHRCGAVVDIPCPEDPGEALEHIWGRDHLPKGQAVWLWEADRVRKQTRIILQQWAGGTKLRFRHSIVR